jgi:hypothetical protein
MTGKLNIVGSNTDTEMTKRKSNENQKPYDHTHDCP